MKKSPSGEANSHSHPFWYPNICTQLLQGISFLKITCISCLSYACNLPFPLYHPWCDHVTNIWEKGSRRKL